MKNKIVLTGNHGVGKTAIRKCLLLENFREKYIPSIGISVAKTTPLIKENTLFIWDLPGEVNQNKVLPAHFLGSNFVLYIVDLTRPSTYLNIRKDIKYFHSILPDIPTVIVGNKRDLISASQLLSIQSKISYSLDIITSAKTRENISSIHTLPALLEYPKKIAI